MRGVSRYDRLELVKHPFEAAVLDSLLATRKGWPFRTFLAEIAHSPCSQERVSCELDASVLSKGINWDCPVSGGAVSLLGDALVHV